MRMIAGAILVHAAAIVFVAIWLVKLIESDAGIGRPESRIVTIAAVALGAVGLLAIAWGAATDRKA